MFKDLPLADLAARVRVLFSGAHTTPEIVALVTPFGYDAAALDAALDLVEDVEALTTAQRAEYADQFAATGAARTAFAALEALYTRHRSLARLSHPRSSEAYRALALAGRAPNDAAGLLRAAESFYGVAETRPDLAATIRTLDAAALDDARAHRTALRAALDAQAKESSEAQRATALRDDAVARLRARAADFAAIAKIALAGTPQLRERLGLLERS